MNLLSFSSDGDSKNTSLRHYFTPVIWHYDDLHVLIKELYSILTAAGNEKDALSYEGFM